ncbi:MAG: alpha/beta hydrolase [Novosphingobium sp.]
MTSIESLRENAIAAGSAFWREASRRAGLVRESRPEGVSGPRLNLLMGELGVIGRRNNGELPEYAASKPQPVMLLPGFGAHPMRMRRLHRALDAAGHLPHDWGLGFNLGPTPQNFAYLLARVGRLSRAHGRPIALVGWSLGGIYAREIACRQPDTVSCVITLGTPFSGDRHANNAWRAYQLVTGHPVTQPPIEASDSPKPPVPTIALWSPRDGVVSPRSACGWPEERDRAVALRCNHLNFPSDPKAIGEILRQLDWDGYSSCANI